MKLLLSLLLLPAMVLGQNNNYGNLGDHHKSVFATPGTDSFYYKIATPIYDTVPVLLLYSDTAKIMVIGWEYFKEDTAATRRYADTTKNIYFGWIGKRTRDTTWKDPNPNVYWMKGYEVRVKFCCVNGNTSDFLVYQPVPYYEHREYLDADKKPLSKNIVVWISKRIYSGEYLISD